MKKIIYRSAILIFLILVSSIVYLSVIGLETNRYNNQIINEDELFKFNKLSRIVTDTALFNNKFYSNIKKRQNEYYLNCKKLKKYKSIKSAYYLEGKHWERYKELGINVGYGYYGKSAEDILEERKKKKNETAN